MPNAGHRWTPEEEKGAIALDWDRFRVAFPGITRGAYRIRRKALANAFPGALHDELTAFNPTSCKVCRFLRSLPAIEADAWREELAKRPKGRDGISHYAVVSALKANGVVIEESSVRRHRRNHLG